MTAWSDNRGISPITNGHVAKISVVTVCLNMRDCIRLTLDSIARQSYSNMEHVIIDGGSKDGTQDIIGEYRVGYFVSEKDDGIYHAMDKGARAASGDVLIFLNAGDTFYDDYTCADVAAFFESNDADIVFGNLLPVYLSPNDSHDHTAFSAGQLLDLSYIRNRRQLYDESIHHQATFYRRWIFDRCTYLCSTPEANGEYNVLLNAVMKQHARVKHIPQPVSRFLLGGTSTRDFTKEWPKYVRARDILRSLYCPNPSKIRIKSKNEFSTVPTSRGVDKLRVKSWLKHRIKRSFAFRLYDRLGVGMTARIANAMLPTIEQVRQEIFQVKKQFGSLVNFASELTEIQAVLAQLGKRIDILDIEGHEANAQVKQLSALTAQIDHNLQATQAASTKIQLNLAQVIDSVSQPADFSQSGYKVFSQWNEDGLIQYLISRANVEHHNFVEIGTGDYSEANTRLLLQKHNWTGLIVDCNTSDMQRVRDSDLYWRHSLKAVDSFVDAENVNALLADHHGTSDLGLLSIDIDGVDYWIWKAITAVSPEIVICEYNGLFGSEAKVTVPYDPRFDRTAKHYSWLYAGASLGALTHLARQKGYTLVGTNNGGNNAFFVRDDVLRRSAIHPARHLFVRPMFRESRNMNGSLSYIDIADGIQLLKDMTVWDVEQERLVRIADIPLSYQ